MMSPQIPGCPHLEDERRAHAQTESTNPSRADRPRLMRFSEVESAQDPDSSLTRIARWTREYLARPHPQLGRKGAVCPFVPLSYRLLIGQHVIFRGATIPAAAG